LSSLKLNHGTVDII